MKNIADKIKILVLALVIGLSVSYAFAWTGPSATPPGSNASAPINVSSAEQVKSGPLKVGGFRSFLPAYVNYDSSSDLSSKGTSFQSLSLAVNGKIGASAYCDQDGNNCGSVGGSGGGIPVGAIMAFDLTACPDGWVTADGTAGTIDARGVFLRGLDKGANKDVDGLNRAVGSYQADQFKNHSHTYSFENVTQAIRHGDSGNMTAAYSSVPANTSSAGGNETRPKNVAVLYCQKS